MSDPRELADRVLTLLVHEDPHVAQQGFELARALELEVRPMVLRDLLREGYRRAPHAFGMCTDSVEAAHAASRGLALWLLARAGVELADPSPEEAREAAKELVRAGGDRRAAAALRQLARFLEADAEDFVAWTAPLVKTLDALAFEADDPTLRREIERRCVELLG